ncbi:MAG: T9SS type A sorting domain-containing protein [Bacteroidales bacterium]|nr:T9SS type A sorting domain-containing protein [Bacteroidales bacterium]
MKNLYTLFICIFIFTNLPAQNPGDLDPAFGGSGVSTVSFLYGNAMNDISIQADEKIVAGGYYQFSSKNLLAFRFKTDGTLDNFGVATWYEADLGDDEMITATKVLPDGKIILAGYYGSPYSSFVIKLLPDGMPDGSFGISGIAEYSADFIAEGIDYYESGGLYDLFLCGHSTDFSSPGIMKLGAFGMIDLTFGTDGISSLGAHDGSYYDIVVDGANDHIYVCGSEFIGNDSYISKHKTNNGSLVSTFGNAGCFTFSAPTGNTTTSTTLLYHSTPNLVTVFGDFIHTDLDRDMFAIRISGADGSLDNTFGVNGWSSMRVPDSDEYINDAVAQNGGKYIFGGYTDFNTDKDFLLGRVMNNGYLDLGFGDAGLVITDVTGEDIINGLALNNDHTRVYAGGVSNAAATDVMASTVACYYTSAPVGVEAVNPNNKLNVSTFPNPCSDIITIKVNTEGNYTLDIVDLTGKLVKQKESSGKSMQMNVKSLDKGVYILNVYNSREQHSSKLVKQ